MSWPKNTYAKEMYELYQQGHSLAQVAKAYQKTRQSVWELFKNRGWEMRRKPKPLPFMTFNGEKYTLRNNGYYGKTRGKRTLMHRDVWEFHNEPIPEGYDIHHRDHNKENNCIDNLECLHKAEHARLYATGNNQYTKKG